MKLFGFTFNEFSYELSYRFFAIGYEVQWDGWVGWGGKEGMRRTYLITFWLGPLCFWFRATSPKEDKKFKWQIKRG